MRVAEYEEMVTAITRFKFEFPDDFARGVDEFFDLVYPLPQNINATHILSFDYLLWDFEYEPGHTIALDMAENDHSLDEWARAKYTRLVPAVFDGDVNYFFDAFEQNGMAYAINDPAIRPHWDEGSLGCRIALDEDGYWKPVGKALLHDNAPFSTEVYPHRVSLADDLYHLLGGDWNIRSMDC